MADKKRISLQNRPPMPSVNLATGHTEGAIGTESAIERLTRDREKVRVLEHRIDDLQRQNEDLMKATGEKKIVLRLSDGRECLFERVTIQPKDIESATYVNELNGRNQQYVTPLSVDDIIQTLKVGGQIYPAIGVRSEDGRILILAGSRRRMACITASHPYDVIVSEDLLHQNDIAFLSSASNSQKPLSIVDTGLKWASELRTIYSDRESLAAAYNVTKMTVSRALKAAEVPSPWVSLVPDVSCLTHKLIDKLWRASQGITADGIESTACAIRNSLDLTHVVNPSDEDLVAAIVDKIVDYAGNLPKQNLAPTKSKGGRPSPRVLFSEGGKEISLQSIKTKTGYSLQLKGCDLSADERDKLSMAIEELIRTVVKA